jgi:adenosylcobinamide-GDP ribazoletransferase
MNRLLDELRLAFTALQAFTRVPVPAWVGWSPAQAQACVRYLPVVGALVGAVAALVHALALHWWPAPVAVLLAMAATLLVTGAFHEDGLADSADGLGGGGADRAKVLAIMQDPRVGSFGVVALVLALALKFQLLAALPAERFAVVSIAAHMASRCSALWVMVRLPYLREDGPSKSRSMAARLSVAAWTFAALTTVPALAALGLGMALAVLVTAVAAGGVAVGLLRRGLGGWVGDTLGAAQQCTELAILMACVAFQPGLSHA